MNCVDLNATSRELLPPGLRVVHVVATAARRRRRRSRGPTGRPHVEAEAGMFGRALLDGPDVLGWMQVVPAALVRGGLPTGAPSPDSYLLACAFFYDEQFLPGFQMLLQDVVAAVKLRRVVALEAYALRAHEPRRALRRLPARAQPLQRPRARGQRLLAAAHAPAAWAATGSSSRPWWRRRAAAAPSSSPRRRRRRSRRSGAGGGSSQAGDAARRRRGRGA